MWRHSFKTESKVERFRNVAKPRGSLKSGGREAGTPNKASGEARALCAALIKDSAYHIRLRERLVAGELAPAIEILLWHYAAGRPREDVDSLTQAQAAALFEALVQAVRGNVRDPMTLGRIESAFNRIVNRTDLLKTPATH